MSWKRAFLTVGLTIAKTMIPGVAGMEEAIVGLKRGGDRHAAVVALVKNGLLVGEALTDQALLADQEFLDGIDLQIRGTAKIMNALKRRGEASLPSAPAASVTSPGAGIP